MRSLCSFAVIIALSISGSALHCQKMQRHGAESAAVSKISSRVPIREAAGTPVAPDSDRCCGDAIASATASPAARLSFSAKARRFEHLSLGPGAFIAPLFTAGPELASPPAHYPGEWREGAAALGRTYGDALAMQTAAQTGRFLAGAVLHEDPRYRPSTSRNPFVRTMHAMMFTVFDQSDSGHSTVAFSNFAGAVSAGFVGNAYLPRGYDDTSHAISRMNIAFGSFAGINLFSEFTPELRRLGKRLGMPKRVWERPCR